jgi:hypothetical protein
MDRQDRHIPQQGVVVGMMQEGGKDRAGQKSRIRVDDPVISFSQET